MYALDKEVVIVNRIKELRISAGLKQADLAAKMNTTKATISKYELEQRDLGVDTIKALCSIFSCSADYLLGLSDFRKPQLSDSERSVLSAYRKADERTREIVRLALDPFSEEEQFAETAL